MFQNANFKISASLIRKRVLWKFSILLLFLANRIGGQEFRTDPDSDLVAKTSKMIIEIGYYEPVSGKPPQKGESVPLKYIEAYAAVNGQFCGLKIPKKDRQLETIAYSKNFRFVNEFHKNLTYDSIAKNKLIQDWHSKEPGFHSYIPIKKDGTLDYSPQPAPDMSSD